MQITADQKKRTLISLTPLIDVVFILLVFFMLVTEFAKFSVVSLGIADQDTVTAIEQTSSIVRISSNGELHFDGREINFSELTALARNKLAANEKHVFFIHPEDDTLLQDTVFVLDELITLAPDNVSFLREQGKGPS
ncbi:MAG: biopolymer transporter ExbD [Gammaproteobacteria bacterium]|nr:biopolymer transporter ExbD [Gammaproteobacteria bacterium]